MSKANLRAVGEFIGTQQPKAATSSAATTQAGEPTNADKQIINDLFARLQGIFPAWRSAFDGEEGVRDAKRAWLAALVRHGVTTPELLNRGIAQAEKQTTPFLPSTGQFIDWCKGGNEACNPVLGLEYKRPAKPTSREERLAMVSRFGAGLRDALHRPATERDREALK